MYLPVCMFVCFHRLESQIIHLLLWLEGGKILSLWAMTSKDRHSTFPISPSQKSAFFPLQESPEPPFLFKTPPIFSKISLRRIRKLMTLPTMALDMIDKTSLRFSVWFFCFVLFFHEDRYFKYVFSDIFPMPRHMPFA